MTDIVERLRRLYVDYGTSYVQEAADKIETLRQRVKELEEWKESATESINTYVDLLNERDPELATLTQAQGEPVACYAGHRNTPEGTNEFYGYADNKLTPGTMLYTSAPSIPEGYVLVPVEPTDDMQEAGCDVDCPQDGAPTPYSVYKAMLAAANERMEEQEVHLLNVVRAWNERLAAEREVSDKLENALVKLLDNHTSLINAGECGSWNVEKESEVISARAAHADVAAIREQESRNYETK